MATAQLPVSLVAHTSFCPRRAWLESVGEQVRSFAIEMGQASHAAVDERRGDRPSTRRSVSIVSGRLGLVGRCDVLEISDGGVRVIEHKSAPYRRESSVTQAQRIQLALQGECLKDMGFRVVGYGVYFSTTRRLVDVAVSEEDLVRALELVAETRGIVESPKAPPPLPTDDPRCSRCSHAGVCLPDERRGRRVRRRILVGDPEGEILHLTVPGSRASMRHGRVAVVRGPEELASLPVERVAGIVVHGNVDVSGALIRDVLWRRGTVVWCTGRGRVVGFAASAASPNGLPRVRQHVESANGNMALARELIRAKIANQATQLRRGSTTDVAHAVSRLRELARAAQTATSVRELFGLEGDAAATYFAEFLGLLKSPHGASFARLWPGRWGRGATDPLNVALNLAYGLLLADCVRAVVACGLDPHAGFVHSSSRNKPALALDLMEQFRPVVADSCVVGSINNGELTGSMFTPSLGDWRLTDAGRGQVVRAYERRVRQLFRHPVFQYRVTWRRAMEIQARMILGVLDGTQENYLGIRTR